MNTNPSLKERFLSEMPDFFKVAHVIGFILIIAAAIMAALHVSAAIDATVGSFGTAISGLSLFVMKNTPAISNLTLDTATGLLPDVLAEIKTLKDAFTNPAPIPSVGDAIKNFEDENAQANAIKFPATPVDQPQ